MLADPELEVEADWLADLAPLPALRGSRSGRALSRQGRYQDVAANLKVKEVRISESERFVRVTPGGLLRTDAAKVKAETNVDGKYLLRTSDPKLSAEDIALGYKRLLEVERGWRDLKQVIDLRPGCHRKEQRIRAHVILCWLALLLIRIAETTSGTTWAKIAGELDLLTLGTFTGPAGTYRQIAELTKAHRDLLAKLRIPAPKKIIEATPAAP